MCIRECIERINPRWNASARSISWGSATQKGKIRMSERKVSGAAGGSEVRCGRAIRSDTGLSCHAVEDIPGPPGITVNRMASWECPSQVVTRVPCVGQNPPEVSRSSPSCAFTFCIFLIFFPFFTSTIRQCQSTSGIVLLLGKSKSGERWLERCPGTPRVS